MRVAHSVHSPTMELKQICIETIERSDNEQDPLEIILSAIRINRIHTQLISD